MILFSKLYAYTSDKYKWDNFPKAPSKQYKCVRSTQEKSSKYSIRAHINLLKSLSNIAF